MYRVVGADNREYGPIDEGTVRDWITQGRANAETLVRYEDGGAWKPLRTFEEFRETLGLPKGTILAAPLPSVSTFGTGARSNGFATAGLIFSTLGCCCPVIGPALGILLSVVALAQINSDPRGFTTSTSIPKTGLFLGVVFLTIHLWVVFG